MAYAQANPASKIEVSSVTAQRPNSPFLINFRGIHIFSSFNFMVCSLCQEICTLLVFFCFTAPRIFPILWKICRPLISEDMKNKIHVLGCKSIRLFIINTDQSFKILY